MFEQAAQEKIQQFDDDSEEDIWEEKPISFDKSSQHNNRPRCDLSPIQSVDITIFSLTITIS